MLTSRGSIQQSVISSQFTSTRARYVRLHAYLRTYTVQPCAGVTLNSFATQKGGPFSQTLPLFLSLQGRVWSLWRPEDDEKATSGIPDCPCVLPRGRRFCCRRLISGGFRGGKGGANAPPFLPSSLEEAYVVRNSIPN